MSIWLFLFCRQAARKISNRVGFCCLLFLLLFYFQKLTTVNYGVSSDASASRRSNAPQRGSLSPRIATLIFALVKETCFFFLNFASLRSRVDPLNVTCSCIKNAVAPHRADSSYIHPVPRGYPLIQPMGGAPPTLLFARTCTHAETNKAHSTD